MKTATTVQLRNPRTVGHTPDGNEARLTAGGRVPVTDPTPAEPLRPAGHGTGLDGPVCPQRGRSQFPDDITVYRTRMCARCGRITALLDTDGVAWCGGAMPAEYLPTRPARHLQVVR